MSTGDTIDLEEIEALEAAYAADDDAERASGARPGRLVLVSVVALVLAVYLQVALAIDTRILGALPDLIVIVLVGLALRLGPAWGALIGFVAGIALDVALQLPLGVSALVLTPIGWGVGAFAATRRRVSLAMALVVLLAAVVAKDLGDVLLAAFITGDPLAWRATLITGVAGAMLTLLAGIPILLLVRRLLGVPEAGR